MIKVWDGPTPYDSDDPKYDAFAQFTGQDAYRRAMNSPGVMVMYEKLHSLWLGAHWQDTEIAEALALYEADLKEAHDGQE